MRDPARAVGMADPNRNPQFRRRWAEPPPLKRERPRIAGTIQGAQNSFNGSNNIKNNAAGCIIQAANALDRIADIELQRGHTAEAERLAHHAEALRAEVAA